MRLGIVAMLLLTGCATSLNRNLGSTGSTAPSLAPTEGMWLPNALPHDRLKALGFEPTQAFADHLRLASVQIGASGSFVSPDGLILTNHHVALGGLSNISTGANDYVANGFLARTRADEVKLPGEEASVLVSIEDVTARVNAAVDPRLAPEDAVKARRAVFATIERESLEQTGFQSNVVTLYGGALYHLYRYKRYTDIRMVFAPEFQAAFFGGDPDNFEYPRYCLDIAVLRAYEDGKPAHVENYLKLSPKGMRDGELVLVSGHPGHTDRLLPTSALRNLRDYSLPLRIEGLRRAEQVLLDYSSRNDEARRQAKDELFYIQNSRKASLPQLALLNSGFLDKKQNDEDRLRARLRSSAELKHFNDAWDRIAQTEAARQTLELRMYMLEWGRAFNTHLFSDARQIIRAAAEDPKPDAERLPEFTQSKREGLEHGLFAEYPFYRELEVAKLAASLAFFRDKLGRDDPLVKRVLRGMEPAACAEQLINGSKLDSAAERKRLYQAGATAIEASTDPMIQLARDVDAEARAVRRDFESKVAEPQTPALADINRARFALSGGDDYPDATGTLRLAFGIVKGYTQDGQSIPRWTTFGGAFEHEKSHGMTDPYILPASWKAAAARIGDIPLDFVCTADITGGNSGSPVVNRAGEQVGIIFDSNRQGIADNLGYTDNQARAVAVDSRGILAALREIYHADALLKELHGE